jgi:glycosyltransferase involved in cell wall biosynthesis
VIAAPHLVLAAVGDPESPSTWSGTTAGILLGLRELGVTTEALDLTLAFGVEQAVLAVSAARSLNRYDAQSAALTTHLRSRLARQRLRGRRLDGVIQVGSTFSLPRGLGYVTLEDMTLRQGAAIHPVFGRMSPHAVERWERRRARIYDRARMCTVASHWAADSLVLDYGVARERVAVVGLGANHVAGAAACERTWASPRILFVGIDWERKGGPVLLRAFSRLREVRPEATLDLAGGHPPVDQPGVIGHGMLSQTRARDRDLMAELFARATCFVMPSLIEPFGIAHIEAASAGVPSIGGSVGGPRDLIGEDGGAVVDPGDEEALFAAMLRLADPATARRAGAAARERSLLYTWGEVAERLLRALGVQAPDGRRLAEFL